MESILFLHYVYDLKIAYSNLPPCLHLKCRSCEANRQLVLVIITRIKLKSDEIQIKKKLINYE